MSRIAHISAYNLAYDDAGVIADERSGHPFDSENYSLMKYGDRQATTLFAQELGRAIVGDVPELIKSPDAPEFLVAYKSVPPACHYLSRYVLDLVNETRIEAGHEPGRLIHVYKDRVAATNYAAASQAERQAELDSIGFSLEGRDMSNKAVIVLDDIRITGAAEKKMLEVLQNHEPAIIGLGYVAIFNSEQASNNPSVENDLNASVVKGVDDLLPLIKADNFDLNIRTLKLILATPSEALSDFLSHIPLSLLTALKRGGVDTGKDFVEKYAAGMDIVNMEISARQGEKNV